MNEQEPGDNRGGQTMRFEAERTHSISFSAACQPACQQLLLLGSGGEKAVLGSHRWCGAHHKMPLEKGNVHPQLPGSGQLALFSPAPKGLIIEA